MIEPTAGIRLVAFDIGGVLVPSPLGPFAEVDTEYGLRPGTTIDLFRGGSAFAKCETGRMSFADFCACAVVDVEAEQGVAVPPERLGAAMRNIMGGTVIDSMRELVLELKAAGVRIGLLSNIYAELEPWMRSVFPPGTVDVFCPSYAVGLRKPDPKIYHAMLEMADLAPDQVAFVDDFPENVEGAGTVGLHGILFTGVDHLRDELRGLGLPVGVLIDER